MAFSLVQRKSRGICRRKQAGYLNIGSIAAALFPRRFRVQDLFRGGEQGAHFEAYNPTKLGIVRRNQLTYSSQFSNAIWTRSNLQSVVQKADGIGDKLIENAINGFHNLSYSAAAYAGVSNVATMRVKPGERSWWWIQVGASAAYFDLVGAGSTGLVTGGLVATIALTADQVNYPGYYDLAVSGIASSAVFAFGLANANSGGSYAGDGASGAYIARVQLEWNTAAPSLYQDVTDWNTEYMTAVLESIGMWQDWLGSIPVTAVEQPVGMWRDTRAGTAFGPDQITNGAFATLAGWTAAGGATVTATTTAAEGLPATVVGTVVKVVSNGNLSGVEIAITTTPGIWYCFKGSAYGKDAASQALYFSNTNAAGGEDLGNAQPWLGSSGSWDTKTCWFRATAATTYIRMCASQVAGRTAYFTGISVKAVVGNHATQAIGSARPTLSAKYNLLLNTAFTGGVAGTPGTGPTSWTLNSQNGTGAVSSLAFPATGQITFFASANGREFLLQQLTLPANTSFTFTSNVIAAAGDGVSSLMQIVVVSGAITPITPPGAAVSLVNGGVGRRTVVFSTGAAGATVTVRVGVGAGAAISQDTSVTMEAPDLRYTDDVAKNIPAYQRVNTATDYDTDGFPHYLKFDGIDDSLATSSIDFTGVDKMTVWTAVTKLSDAATALIAELSAAATTNNGAFYLAGPSGAGLALYQVALKGSAAASSATTLANYAAPNSSVLTGLFDFAGAVPEILRVNGVQQATQPANVGTGPFGNYPLNIGRRNNTSLPFTGRVHSLTVRGSTTPTSEKFISQMNRYAANLMAITI